METVSTVFNVAVENRDVIFATLLGIVTIASLFVAGTRTPDPATFLGKVYKVIEYAALNFGKAKDTGEKPSA
jgi:hypothetical protein